MLPSPFIWISHLIFNSEALNMDITFPNLEAVVQKSSLKKVFLEISQNSQENTVARVSFLIKLQASGLQLYKKETLA